MRIAQLLWHASVVCTGMMSGFIVAFAIAIMPGLGRMDSLSAIHTMNAINSTIGSSPLFFILFGGAGLVHVLGLLLVWNNRKIPSSWLVICAALLYLCGVLFITLCFNIPLNREMAGLDVTIPGNGASATELLAKWTFWNNVRAASSFTSVLFMAFYRHRKDSPST